MKAILRATLAAALAGALFATPVAVQAAPLDQVLQQSDQFKTLQRLLGVTENADWFVEEGEAYTLFAPTDAAFAKLPAGVVDALIRPENRSALNAVLEHHVIPDAAARSTQLKTGQSLSPASGMDYRVQIAGGTVTVKDARVVKADIQTDNGVVHAIDAVLLPDLVVDALKQRGVLPAN